MGMDSHVTSKQDTKLRQWRRGEALSIYDVSDLSGVSPSMLSRLERGIRQPSPRMKIRIATALGVRVSVLF